MTLGKEEESRQKNEVYEKEHNIEFWLFINREAEKPLLFYLFE